MLEKTPIFKNDFYSTNNNNSPIPCKLCLDSTICKPIGAVVVILQYKLFKHKKQTITDSL